MPGQRQRQDGNKDTDKGGTMEKLNMIRKKVSVDAATEFKFESPCCVFLVKNMTKGDIFLSFGGAPKSTDEMLMLPAGSLLR